METNEVVAIKKVLQDKRFKNRELQIMRQLVKDPHTNIVALKHCFYSQVRAVFAMQGNAIFRCDLDLCERASVLCPLQDLFGGGTTFLYCVQRGCDRESQRRIFVQNLRC